MYIIPKLLPEIEKFSKKIEIVFSKNNKIRYFFAKGWRQIKFIDWRISDAKNLFRRSPASY